MPITVAGLRVLSTGRPVTVVSPLVEMGSALHALSDPAHHQADRWADEVRSRLSPALARRRAAYACRTYADK